MSLVLQTKRAAKDKGLYNGETDSLNWEPSHVIMYDRLCNRFGGHFTSFPTRANQSQQFLEFIDKYKDPEYTEGAAEKPKQVDGTPLKSLIPDPLPVNQEGAANKREVQQRQEMVNGNVLKVATKPPAPTEPPKVADNEANKADEKNATDSSNTDANKENNSGTEITSDSANDSANAGSDNGTQPGSTGETGKETSGETGKESTDTGTSNTQSNTSSTGTAAPTVAPKTQTESKPSTNAQGKSGTTVKVR